MMFYCEECRIKNKWPEAFGLSHGKCECCDTVTRCHDRPSSTLPPVRRTPAEQPAPASTGREHDDGCDYSTSQLPTRCTCKPRSAPAAARELDVEAERREFEADYTANQQREGANSEYIFLSLQRRGDGEYSTTYVNGRWHGWLAARSAAPGTAPAPAYGPVHVVADLVRNLLTLDQAMPIHAAFHVDFDGKRRCRTRPVIVSRERVIDGKWVDGTRKDVPYAAIVWAKPQQDESAPVSTEQAGDAWISVEDRLPDESLLRFLVTGRAVSGGPLGVHMATLYDGDMYFEGAAESGGCNPCINDVVTHWMPLPSAPSPNNSPVGGKGEQ